MSTIKFQGEEHRTAGEALIDLADDQHAILFGGRYFTLSQQELERVQLEGFQPTILTYNEAAETIMTVPGLHG